MSDLANSFLTPAEQDRVSATVQLQEKQTSGEIIPLISSASHSYPASNIIGALIFSIPLAIIATPYLASLVDLSQENMWVFLLVSLCSFPLVYQLVKYIPGLQRLFLLPKEIEERVQDAAISAFYSEKLYATKEQNGILIYISVLERKVWVLADHGINTKIDQSQWDEIVMALTAKIKTGSQCDAICTAVEKIGSILTVHFPIQENDTNELHNLIIKS